MKMGILGGTFNPVHNAHLVLAQEVKEKMKLDRIIFIPSAHPPHKTEHDLASSTHRLNMLELAIQKKPFFSLSTLELERGGKSYSIETMKALRKLY
ncbi:MAG: nicotinate-nicotinamide nucleotide adenylyltransferase, partial [Candidatus Omnitrophica bacterium]|nr:nicotinate-nicotinamide nucleotide adenylyltransferase [Candidatus Omnitrophota bacterium]